MGSQALGADLAVSLSRAEYWLANHDGTLPIHMLKQWGRIRRARSREESVTQVEIHVDKGER
jgi:hypothetical protein